MKNPDIEIHRGPDHLGRMMFTLAAPVDEAVRALLSRFRWRQVANASITART